MFGEILHGAFREPPGVSVFLQVPGYTGDLWHDEVVVTGTTVIGAVMAGPEAEKRA